MNNSINSEKMPEGEKKQTAHEFTVRGRKTMQICGVSEVISFDENSVVAGTSCGEMTIEGAGLGIIYFVGATTGGVDIVAKFMRQRFAYINFGTLILILDAVIIMAYALILNKYESAMYSIICMFVTGRVIDLVLYGIDNSSVCYIISTKNDEISHEIISGHLHRGVTLLNATGAYSGERHDVIMCVIKRPQISELKRLVKGIDEHAFVVVTDAKNVFGNGFESISEVK